MLFSAVWRTLHSFGYTYFGAETGAICVLYSWGQNLSLLPHIHCIVPAAGYNIKGTWKPIGTFKDYLYPAHQLIAALKGEFLDSLKRALSKLNILDGFDQAIQQAYQKRWVVNCQPSMAKADHVIKYLGQYTLLVAIRSQRIIEINTSYVKFISKDYRNNAKKTITFIWY